MVTCDEAVTVDVLTVNVAEVCPAGTVTEEGTDAAAPLLARLTARPPLGACAFSVTVPVADDPPVTAAGEIDRLAKWPLDPPGPPPPVFAGFTVSTAVTVFAEDALIVTVVIKVT